MFGMNNKMSMLLTAGIILAVVVFAIIGVKCFFNFFDVVSLNQKDTYLLPEPLVDLVKSSIQPEQKVDEANQQIIESVAVPPLRDTEQDYPNVYKIGKVEYGPVFDKDEYFIGDSKNVESLDKVNDGSLQQ